VCQQAARWDGCVARICVEEGEGGVGRSTGRERSKNSEVKGVVQQGEEENVILHSGQE